jgi:Large polyvalent protein associated domain 38
MPVDIDVPGLGPISVPDNVPVNLVDDYVGQIAKSKGIELPKPEIPKKPYTVGAGLRDVAVSAAGIVPGLIETGAEFTPVDRLGRMAGADTGLAGLVKGFAPEYAEDVGKLGLLRGTAKSLRDLQKESYSEQAKAAQQAFAEKLAKEKTFLGEAGTAIGETLTTPELLTSNLPESLASMVGGRGIANVLAKGAKRIAPELTEAAGERAAKVIGEKGMKFLGGPETIKTVAGGAAMQGASVANQNFNSVMEMKEDKLAETPEYQDAIKQGASPEDARRIVAENAASGALLPATALSLVSQYAVPGGHSVEQLIAGATNKTLGKGALQFGKQVAKSFAGEGVSEAVEEGGGQYIGNVYTPGQENLMQGVGAAAGAAGAMGALMGGGAGGINALQMQRAQQVMDERKLAEDEKERATPDVPELQHPFTPSIAPEAVPGEASKLSGLKTFGIDDVINNTEAKDQGSALSVINHLNRRGDIVPDGIERYDTVQDNNVVGSYDTREEAEATGLPVFERPKFRFLDETEKLAPTLGNDQTYLFATPTMREGEEKVDGYKISSPGLNITREAKNKEEADHIVEQFNNGVKTQVEELDKKIDGYKKATEQTQEVFNKAISDPNVTQDGINELRVKLNETNETAKAEIEKIEQQKQSLTQEPLVEPINPQRETIQGYQVSQYRPGKTSKVVQPFATKEEAEKYIVDNAPLEQLKAIASDDTRPELKKRLIEEAPSEAPLEAPLEAPEEVIKATPEMQQKIDAVSSRMRGVLDQMGLKDVGLKVQQRFQESVNGKLSAVDGHYLNRVISASLEGSRDVTATIGHETIHALRELGMFSDKEWNVLTKKAKSEWIKKYDIESRYKDAKISDEKIVEEAVADAFGNWLQGNLEERGVVAGLFNRIKSFLNGVGSALRGQGFTTSESVFERARAGELKGKGVSRPSKDAQFAIDMTERRERQLLSEEEQESRQLINASKNEQVKKQLDLIYDEALPWFKKSMNLIERSNKLKDLGIQVEIPRELNDVNDFWNNLTLAVDKLQYNEDAGLEANNIRFYMKKADDLNQALSNYVNEAHRYGNSLPNRGRLKSIKNSILEIVPNVINLKQLPKEKTQYALPQNVLGQPATLPTWTEPTDSKTDSAIYILQDKMIDVKRVVQEITKAAGVIADRWNPYLQEELYHGRTAQQTERFLRTELRPLLADLAKHNITTTEFEEFLHNRHAKERNDQIASINPSMPDAGSGIATQTALNYLNGLPPARRRLLDSIAQKVDDINRGTRQILVKSGLETPQTIASWEQTYPNYVPLFREDADYVTSSGYGVGQGFNIRGDFSKRTTGSTRNVVDILANVVMQRERAIVRAEKNRVAEAVYGLAVQNPNKDFWLPIDPEAIKDVSKIQNELINLGINPNDIQNIFQQPTKPAIDPRTGLVTNKLDPFVLNSDNILTTRINGRNHYVLFNNNDPRAKRMVTALKNLDADQLGRVMSIMGTISRWISSVNTQYNPVFGVINFFRDVQGAALNLSTTPIADKLKDVMSAPNLSGALKGIWSVSRAEKSGAAMPTSQWAKLWQELQDEGGQTGYRSMYSSAEERAKAIQKEINQIGEGKLKHAGRAMVDVLSDYNTSMENAVRLTAYKAALDKGLSKQQAASIAKNITVNFNRKGQIATQAGALYAFFNASVQGNARLLETLKGPMARKIIGGGLLLGWIQAAMLAAAGFDEDEPPEFLKERNFVIPIGGKQYISIPMPLGFNLLPNTSRNLVEWFDSGFHDSGKKITNITGSMIESFNPIGGGGWSLQTISPTAVDPFAALAENKDAFGRPIYKKDLNPTDPTPGYLRTKDTATAWSKSLSEFLNMASGGTKYKPGVINVTPDQIDYLVGQAGGGVAREISKVEQTISSAATGEELPPYKIPLVGRFYGSAESNAAQSQKYYENITRLNEHENEIKGRRKNHEPVYEYIQENPEARLVPIANSIENRIKELRQQKKRMVERGATPEQVKQINDRIVTQMKRLNEQVARVKD